MVVAFDTTAEVKTFAATNLILSFLGQCLRGDFTFTKTVVNGATALVAQGSNIQLTLGDGNNVIVQVTQGSGFLQLTNQTLTGDFTIQQATTATGTTTVVGLQNASLTFRAGSGASAATILDVTSGQGTFVVTSQGVAGQISGNVALAVPGVPVTFSGQFNLAINQTNQPVEQSLVVGTKTVALSLPRSPFVQVSGTGVQLTVGSATGGSGFQGAKLQGNFVFQQLTVGGQSQIQVAASGGGKCFGTVWCSPGGVVRHAVRANGCPTATPRDDDRSCPTHPRQSTYGEGPTALAQTLCARQS